MRLYSIYAKKAHLADIKIDFKEVTVQKLHDKEFQDSTGYLYVKYIKSSLFYTKDFRIKVNGDNKCGYLGYVYDYVSESNSLLEVNESNLEVLFPAVVMMNHLVMLPENITTGIGKYPRELLWSIKPFDLGGAILVDFQNEASLINALKY